MKSFWLNGYSGRQERWALDGHRWVAAEPRRNGFDLWGYQDDAPEIVYLGSGANEEQLEKLADEFLLGDPEIINPAFFLKDAYQWDLGLAKAVSESSFQTAVSTPGGFVGTPEFASPEQFAGLALDTRSDLYSLGWHSGRCWRAGRHFGARLVRWCTNISTQRYRSNCSKISPQPLVALLEVLLEKDPGRRFQNPGELLKAMPTIAGQIGSGA
jgi:serine/threonine protein kinase